MKFDIHRAFNIAGFIVFAAVILVLVLSIGKAFGADAELSWTAPTEREDGTPLAPADIAGYDIEWGKCGQAADTLRVGPVQSHTITGLGYGEWCFRVRTVDSTDLMSAWTGPVQKIILAPPKPPVFEVVNIVAYEVQWNPGRGTVLGRAVGTVPLGTECGENVIVRRGMGEFHEVSLDMVDLQKLPKSLIVVAACEAA